MAEMGLSVLNEILSGVASSFAQVPAGTEIDYPGVGLGMGDPLNQAFWSESGGGYRPIPQIAMVSPDGRIGVWMHAGRPLLWSKDAAAVKRVKRIASRYGGLVGRRAPGRRRRGGR